ncbi:NAD(P)H-dependent flavin oxidoreductase, partial [Mariniphaga sediminis]|uniref:NAD(P)H-dependent flavin oxidoreductase n=1 Tax=Mariniphaga sediminis TaxID=1628158 RepID=UPI003562D679
TATGLPLLAAGGVATGQSMLAAMALGADGVQVGSRFAISEESSAHPNFKQLVSQLGEGKTLLTLKKLAPVRMVINRFFEQVDAAEKRGASVEELRQLLGKGRAKKGIFEGDLEDGELEIGQVSAQINEVLPVREIMKNLISEYLSALEEIREDGKFRF